MSGDDKALAGRPGPPAAKPWDSGEHMAPDPSWPAERQLHWYKVASHVLLLNCPELVRRRAGAAADKETGTVSDAPAPEAAAPQALADVLIKAANEKNATSRLASGSRSYERAYQLEGEAIGLDAAAALVRERLSPAWDALTAERDRLQGALTAESGARADERGRLRGELAQARQAHDTWAAQLIAERDEARQVAAEMLHWWWEPLTVPDPETRERVAAWQQRAGLPGDGEEAPDAS